MSSLVNKVKDAISGHHEEESRNGKSDMTDSERKAYENKYGSGGTPRLNKGNGAEELNPKHSTGQGQSNMPGSFESNDESLPSRHKDGREYVSPSGTAVGQGQSGYDDSYASGRGTDGRNVMDPSSEQRGSNVMGGATSGIGGERYEDQGSHHNKLHKREDPRYEESSHHQSKHHGHGHESERKAVPEDQSRSGYGADSSQYSRHGGAGTAAATAATGEGKSTGYGGDMPLASKEFAERRRHPESSKHTGGNDEYRSGDSSGLGSSGRKDYSSTGITGNTLSSSSRNDDQYGSTGATSGLGSSGRDNYGSSGRHEGGTHNTVVGAGSGEDMGRSHHPHSGLTSGRGAQSREDGYSSRTSGAAGMAGGALTGVDHKHSGSNRDEHEYGSRREETDIAKEGRGADPLARERREGQYGQTGYDNSSSAQPGYSSTSGGQPGYSSRSEQPMSSGQQGYSSSSGQPGYSNTSSQQHHIIGGGQQGYGSSREQQPMTGQSGYGDSSQQSSYATPGMGSDMHSNRRVMHKCTGCGQDEDISHYFKKDGVYRMDK